MATLAAVDLRACLGMRVREVWTYGMPRVGDSNFIDAFATAAKEQGEDPPMWRIVHHLDLIPRIPWYNFGYRHAPLEVHYTVKNSSAFELCPPLPPPGWENPGCMLRSASWQCTMSDHTDYLGQGLTFDENALPESCIPWQDMLQKKTRFARQLAAVALLAALLVLSCVAACAFACRGNFERGRAPQGGKPVRHWKYAGLRAQCGVASRIPTTAY